MKLRVAFTLIELLVVIAIIGILSGLIVVSMSGITNKANIAKYQVFSNSLKNSLMLNLVSEWKLDQINYPAAGQTPDVWSGNTGVLKENGYAGACDATHCPQLQTSDCISGNCLSFNGNDYTDCGSGTSLNVANAITVEVWVKTSVNSGAQVIISRDNDWFLSKSSSAYNFQIRNSSNVLVTPGATETSADWLYIVGTYTADSNVKIYINGSLKQALAQAGPIRVSGLPTTIGGQYAWHTDGTYYDYFFNGYIDNVRLYSEAIPAFQIEERYYAGLNRLLANGDISKEEYTKRILID